MMMVVAKIILDDSDGRYVMYVTFCAGRWKPQQHNLFHPQLQNRG